MVSTRSKQQKTTEQTAPKTKVKPEENNKRKAEPKTDEKSKKPKVEQEDKPLQTLKKSDDTDTHSEPIKINRAPVLDLFAACAAQFEHPDLSWSTCLSIGSAVASICAVSKGRATGHFAEKEPDEAKAKESKEKKEKSSVTVLKFELALEDGLACMGTQKKPANEGYLKSKFGDRYDEVRTTMQEALASWKGHEDEFDKTGFRMYEKFRPGSGAWGQKGGLELEKVRDVIQRK